VILARLATWCAIVMVLLLGAGVAHASGVPLEDTAYSDHVTPVLSELHSPAADLPSQSHEPGFHCGMSLLAAQSVGSHTGEQPACAYAGLRIVWPLPIPSGPGLRPPQL
jgi:hypothetical protein